MALNFQGDRSVGVLNDPKNTFNTDDLFRVYDGGILVAGGVSVDHGDFVSWDGTKWKLEANIKIARSDEITNTNSSIAPDYVKQTYPANSYVMHVGVLYTNPNAIAAAEDWNPAHWTQTTVAEMMAGAGGGDSGYTEMNVNAVYDDVNQLWTVPDTVPNRSCVRVAVASTYLNRVKGWNISLASDCTDATIILEPGQYHLQPSGMSISAGDVPVTLFGGNGQVVNGLIDTEPSEPEFTPYFNGFGKDPCADIIIRICGRCAILTFTTF